MHPARRRTALAAVLCLSASTMADSASATIVWEGKVVDHWPDEPVLTAPGTAAAVTLGEGFYRRPRGKVLGLTLLVDFSDQAPAFNVEEVEAWLNEPGFNRFDLNGSIRDYFFDNSNGLVDFENRVHGFYRAKNPKSYYEGGNGYERARELIDELIDYFDDQVDFSEFDNDGDGDTEAISIVYAGRGEVWGQGLWPHAGSINVQRDGVRVARYQMTAMTNRFGLYTFSHEIGHMLFGWPDLYGFGNYCIMGNGSSQTNPVGINDFYRADQGWIDVEEITEDTNVTFTGRPGGKGFLYVNPNNREEAFFWSNIRATDRWSTLRGDGLLLLHFDYGIRRNDPPNLLSLHVVEADGRHDLDQTMWPDPGSSADDFFHAGTLDEVNDETSPSTNWNDSSESRLRIYDIGANSDAIEFSVGYGDPIRDPDDGMGGAAGDAPGGSAAMDAGVPDCEVTGDCIGGAGGETGLGTAGTGGGLASGGSPAGAAGGLMMIPLNQTLESGCGCRVGSSSRSLPATLVLVGVGGFFALRRRRQGA